MTPSSPPPMPVELKPKPFVQPPSTKPVAAPATPPAAIARPRKKTQVTIEQVLGRLRHVSREDDPMKYYRNLIKIGQG